jgi:HEPN domain-containing protein
MAAGSEPLYDLATFCCQQSSEKYLKALIEEMGGVIPKTHSLEKLLQVVTVQHPSLQKQKRGLRFLTKFAVETRYPGENATKRQTAAALLWVKRIRQECRALLGLPPTRRK